MPNLDSVTMYKGLLFGLLAVVLTGEVLALTGVLSISPIGLILVAIVLAISCYAANLAFSRYLRIPSNSESWLLTALIMTCIVAPTTDPVRLLIVALAGLAAMASKYVLIWRLSTVVNPAAAGVFVAGLTGQLPAIWWVATPYMLIVTIPFALITLYRHHKYQMFLAFFVVATGVLLLVNATTQQDSFSIVLRSAAVSWPLIFLGSIMLTEPTTMPAQRYVQLLYAICVGGLATSQLSLGPVHMTPIVALLLGNLFVLMVAPPYASRLKLIAHTTLVDDIHEFTFKRPHSLRFKAGQYADWTLAHSADFKGNRRRFSFASGTTRDQLRIVIRAAAPVSSYKRSLLALQPNDMIRLSNIRGDFIVPSRSTKLLLIAGGIGITPFISMVEDIVTLQQQRDIVLIYMDSNKAFVHTSLFKPVKKYGVRLEISNTRLSLHEVRSLVPDIATRQAYISGPPAMVHTYAAMARRAGIARRAIHTDEFSGY